MFRQARMRRGCATYKTKEVLIEAQRQNKAAKALHYECDFIAFLLQNRRRGHRASEVFSEFIYEHLFEFVMKLRFCLKMTFLVLSFPAPMFCVARSFRGRHHESKKRLFRKRDVRLILEFSLLHRGL